MILSAGCQIKNGTKSSSVSAKTWMIMKLTIILMLFFTFQVTAKSNAQRITIKKNNVHLADVFKDIEQQTGFHFFYDKDLIQKTAPIDIALKDATLEQALLACLKDQQLTYTIVRNTVVIQPQKAVLKSEIFQLNTVAALPPSNEIHGRVVDDKGNPLQDATITIKGTNKGAVTDNNGDFSIDVPDNKTVLIISFTGYISQEVKIGHGTTINITLLREDNSLNSVVVTALGIRQDVRSLTSSSQNVNLKQTKIINAPNVMSSLQGKVAGVSILLGGMGLGDDARVVIRGDRSISGDSQPLYVIDGVPVLGDPTNLNASNIASINILKGPSAAALYGSEAQNGVVIITTKSGSEGGANSMTFNSNYTLRTPVVSYPFQNVYGQGNNGVYDPGSDLSWGPKMEGQMVANWSLDPKDAGTQYALTPQPNNVQDFYRTGQVFTNSLDIVRGGQNVQGAFSYTNTSGTGIMPNNSLTRNNISLRIGGNLLGDKEGSGRLKFDSKISFTQQKMVGDGAQASLGAAEGIAVIPRNIKESQMRNFEFTDSTGANTQNYWVPNSIWDQNPYWRAYRDVTSNTLNRLTGFVSLNYKLSPALNLQARGSYDGEYNNGNQKDWDDSYNTHPFGFYAVNTSNSYLANGDLLLSYNKTYADKWKVNVNVGSSIQKLKSDASDVNTGQGLVIPNFFTLTNSLLPVIGSETASEEVTQSLYAFGRFSFKNDIFLDITGRNDWSSTLPENNLSYFYPSVGVSAIISDLIPSFPKWISLAKVTASGSQVGSGAQPYMLERTAAFSPGGNNGFITLNSVLPSTNLKPEISRSYEAGLIMRFFNDRFGLNLSFYKTNTFNQLFTLNLPIGSGATSFYTNGGNIQNKGIEAVLDATVIHTKNFRWDLDINYSLNRNMVLEINDQRPMVQVGNITIQQGQPFGNIYERGFVRDSTGAVIVGSNGIPEVTAGNTVKVANFNPDWLGSISSTFTYKNFSLNILIDTRQGGSMYSSQDARLYGDGQAKATLNGRDGGLIFGSSNFFPNERAVLANGQKNNIPVTSEDFWQANGGRNDVTGELYRVSATNTRVRSLSLTYFLPLSKYDMFISDVAFSFVGTNLFFLQRATKDADPDLELDTGPDNLGISGFTLPTVRTFGFNVKVDFK